MEVKHRKLADLTPDRKNANKGTPRGSQMIEDSFRQYGAGRSILIDKNGLIIAGNKSAEHAGSIGMDDVLVVQTDGTQLVAVQRMDLDLIKDKRAKEINLIGLSSAMANSLLTKGLIDSRDKNWRSFDPWVLASPPSPIACCIPLPDSTLVPSSRT
jgi:hypothetical protein